MKQKITMVLAALLFAAPIRAQTEAESISEAAADLWKVTRQTVKKQSRRVKEEINGGDLLNVDGRNYMRVYDMNLYADSDAREMRETCMKAFAEKYPSVKIVAAVIPQDGWTQTTTNSFGRVSKYVKTLYCYVLGKDGDDGYINARFSYRQVKKVGQEWLMDDANWPLWERTDVLTSEVYGKLKGTGDK